MLGRLRQGEAVLVLRVTYQMSGQRLPSLLLVRVPLAVWKAHSSRLPGSLSFLRHDAARESR